ncbi:MAG: hypothetical protein V7K40_13925 [Nostoc sp.]
MRLHQNSDRSRKGVTYNISLTFKRGVSFPGEETSTAFLPTVAFTDLLD